MLLIAYLLFYVLNNKESYLGEGMMKWPRREFFNIILVIALTVSVVGADQDQDRAIDKVAEYIAARSGAGLIETPSGARGAARRLQAKALSLGRLLPAAYRRWRRSNDGGWNWRGQARWKRSPVAQASAEASAGRLSLKDGSHARFKAGFSSWN